MAKEDADSDEGDDELQRLQRQVLHLQKDLDHQSEARRAIQANLASERDRAEALEKQNQELGKAAEDRVKGLQRVNDVETSELASQVEALLLVKRQLYQRLQSMDAERSRLLSERIETVSDRACVACLDRLANTVLLRCRHLCCCEGCAKKLTHCPVCRQSVRDRMTVFML